MLLAAVGIQTTVHAAEGEKPRYVEYAPTPPAPASQSREQAQAKSEGCLSCHTETDAFTMHDSPAVNLGCTDCHGGDHSVAKPAGAEPESPQYEQARDRAHVLPRFPETWHYPHSANPEHTYTLLNRESPEFVRFVNPSDYRVAEEACGACHLSIIKAAKRSLMSTGAMLWGGASYNNGILPFKNYIMGEAYAVVEDEEHPGQRKSVGAKIQGPLYETELAERLRIERGILSEFIPLPAWETLRPSDVFRVFERGGRNIINLFPETGIPSALGQLQRLEEPGRPDIRQSNRGPGTGARIAVPVINITKTRLNDPFTWFLGTNDNPGDYRSSGCASCHVVYANDRDPKHSGPYAAFGHTGTTQTADPTIPEGESGHPLKHRFTRSIPTSQCMICHMHQPNMFVNTYLGYTMWDYESDAPFMWPEEQRYPSHSEIREINERNPEEAAIRGKWGDPEFLKDVSELNPELQNTQFADYHGHGWNFRAVFKKDREGNLLDENGDVVPHSDPDKFEKAVHMSSIHADVGMHCVDCHFSQDSHGNGHLYGEVANAVEIDCVDCHGTADEYPDLITSGPASPPAGNDLSLLRNPDGRKRFEWRGGKLYQRSLLHPDREWEVSLVKDSVNPDHTDYNATAARAKLMSQDTRTLEWGINVGADERAHQDDEIECYTCHTSWTTSCGGCHLPIQANWKTERHHYEGGETRNFATYNPQVARDQMFQLGRRGDINGGRIAPVRSSSALVLSSTNANRERIYIQQPPVAASGHSSQAFAPHFPHTVRKTETKTCSDCHLSEDNDNNAIMAQLLLQGTNFVNFVGFNSWVGTSGNVSAVQVTEWDEPQAVIGSYLHRYAYPDWYQQHLDNNRVLQNAYTHESGNVGCLQLRGEYLYVAEGAGGTRVYDVASIANKGFSQRIITAPFSPLGHDTHIPSTNATCVVLPTNQPIHPDRQTSPGFGLSGEQIADLMFNQNQEQKFHPLYNYAFITDSKEGLILTDVNTLSDGEFRNNMLERQLTWNEDGILDGARHLTIGGHYAYVMADKGLVVLNIDTPLSPTVEAVVPLNDGRASALQFRYLFVTDADGFKVIDVTHPAEPKLVQGSAVRLNDAHRIYVARTYAYVAAGEQGLAIVNVEQPEQIALARMFDGGGVIDDARDVVVATTNASLFAYVADGHNGLKVIQLTSPDSQPRFYGYSPDPKPEIVASYATAHPATALSKGLDRDRAVDENGNQIAVLGRLGSRPLSGEEMRRLYLDDNGEPWFVTDDMEAPQKTAAKGE